MRIVVQRVRRASVHVEESPISDINHGLLLLVSAGEDDEEADVTWSAKKVANLRIFSDDDGKMNLSALDTGAQILAVSQFTLHGDCKKGNRPSFVRAMRPDKAETLFDSFVRQLKMLGVKRVETGQFGANMQVALINDGPVTLLLDSKKEF